MSGTRGRGRVFLVTAVAALATVPAAADWCAGMDMGPPEQDGQDVVMTVAGRTSVERRSGGDSTLLFVPPETFDRTCDDPSVNDYCAPLPCGDFRDRCVPAGSHTYAVAGYYFERMHTIDVRDTGAACLRECRPFAWLGARAEDDVVRLSLLTTVDGTLYRFASDGTSMSRTLVATIDPAGMRSRCRQTVATHTCCSPCTAVFDRCPTRQRSNVSYEFAPSSGQPSIFTAPFLVAAAAEGCSPGWELGDVGPETPTCTPEADGDSDAADEDVGDDAADQDAPAEGEAGPPDDAIGAHGGGCACSTALVVRPDFLVLIALLALGALALRRSHLDR